MKKSKTKSILACAVLLSVMSVGALTEAGNFKYRVDGVTEGIWDGSDNIRLNSSIGGGTGTTLEVWEETPEAVSGHNIFGSGCISGDSNDYSGKTVIFYSGEVSYIFGGSAHGGNANDNIVTIEGGDIDATVYGGYSYNGSASGNKVTFNGGAAKFVYGGKCDYAGNSTDNTVIINDGTIYSGNVFGGWSNGGEVRGNKVIINGGNLSHDVDVYGGQSNGTVSGNQVIIKGGTFNGEVYASSGNGFLNSNYVIVSGGDLSNAKVYGYGGTSSSHSNNTLQIENTVTIKEIHNFDNISFVLPTVTGSKNMLSLTNHFSLDNVAVSVYLGGNAISTLNTNNITLADNVSGNFDVTYYDKNNNATGYKEKFNIASAGAMKIGEGTEMHVVNDLATDAGEILGKQDTLYVDSGATIAFVGGTLRKNLEGQGTAEFNNTVGVADGVKLGTSTNIVNGTLDVAGHITAGDIHFKDGSTLKVDGSQIMGTAAITGITGATVASNAKIYVSGAVKNTPYKILSGNGIVVSGWQTDMGTGDLDGGLYGVVMDTNFRAAYGLIVDMSNTITSSNEFTVQFRVDPTAMANVDIGNILSNASPSSELYKFVDTISQVQSDSKVQAAIINTMANMNSLANVQQGTQAVMGMATGALQTNIGTGSRGMLGRRAEGVGRNLGDRGQGSGFRKVSAKADDRGAIEVVEQGKSDEVMPTMVENEEQKYDKTVWANYIHSKKTIDGLKTGHLTQNSTIQYNGVTVGADLWSNAKGFGGLALTAATGKTNSSQDGASVKNDTDYHGVSLYQRYDYKDVAILFDLSYTHAKNDVTMSTAGTADVTAKPKSDAYSAGVKVEYPVKVGRSQLTPYAGLRYTRVHTGKYENSLGISNDIKDQNIVSMPLGVQLKTEFETQREWKFGNIFEGGYVLNIGNRKSEQRLGHQGVYDSIDFDVTDRGEYFLKTGFTAKHKDTDFELGYRFTRSDNTKENKWNFNVTHNFGNSKGLPYKSVLLGKIELLKSANKELRAELVEKDLRIKQLEEELRKLKNK